MAAEKLEHFHLEDIKLDDAKAGVPTHTRGYEIDPVAEKKLLRKLDLRVIPILWLLFLLAFLDRTNIGSSTQKLFHRLHGQLMSTCRQCKDSRHDRRPPHDRTGLQHSLVCVLHSLHPL